MLNRVVRFSSLWFTVLTLCGSALAGCGSVTQSKNEALALRLQLPAGEDPSLFWFGVSRRTLKVTGKGDPVVVDWQEGTQPAVDVHGGDKVEFFGADERGRVLVAGEGSAPEEEKSLTIPVRRVL